MRADCAVGIGFYSRNGYDEDNSFVKDVPIKRYLCRTHVRLGRFPKTFSLLISLLCPYRKYSLKIMSYCMGMWGKFKGRITEAVNNLWVGEDIEDGLYKIEHSHIYQFIKVFKNALRKHMIWKKDSGCSLEDFIGYCVADSYRAAGIINQEYYDYHGGYAHNSHFLFGTASQFRKIKKAYHNDE